MRAGRLIMAGLAIAAFGCSAAPRQVASAPPPPIPAAALEQAAEIVADGVKEQAVPGAAMVVMQGDRLLLARGYGIEYVDRPLPVTPTTVFSLGSISKQFTAALALKLVERDRLGLGDPVARHLPEFTNLPPGLTIHHLLSHTSGMREEFRQPDLNELFGKPSTTFAEYAAAARDAPADFVPGTRGSYSNMNYLMLTLIVERLGGAPLEVQASQQLFAPLGLTSVGLCPRPPGGVAGEARGHVTRDGKLVGHPPENIALFKGSGGFCGNAVDVARWMRALATGKVVTPASYALMTKRAPLIGDPAAADYGYAMSLVDPDGVRRFGHGGYGAGASAQSAYYPDRQLGFVILMNRFVFPEHVERKAVRALLGLPPLGWREIPLSPAERARFAGSFDVGVTGWNVRILEDGAGLRFELPSPPLRIPLMHVGGGRFVSRTDPHGYQVNFTPDGRRFDLLGMGLMRWYGIRTTEAAAR